MEFAEDSRIPYTNEQVLTIIHGIVKNSGMFWESCREWRGKVATDKTYANFKLNFSAAYGELIEDGELNENPYANVNHVHSEGIQEVTNEALIMLAEDTWGDKEALAKLTSTNSKLVVKVGKLNEKISELTKVIVKLAERETR